MQSDYRDTQQPPTLQQALNQSAAEYLYRLVRDFWAGKPRPTRKDDMVSVLLQVASEQSLRKLWPPLGDLYKAAVSESVWSRGGAFSADQFRAKYGRLPGEKEAADADDARGIERAGYQRSRDAPTSLLDLILPRGTLPRDVQLALKQFVPKPEKAKVKVTESPADVFPMPAYRWDPETNKRHEYSKPVPVVWVETEHQAARELLAVLRLADPGKLSISEKSRWPTPTTIRTVTRALDGGDYFPGGADAQSDEDGDRLDARTPGPVRAFAWPMLLEAGGLLHVRKQKLSRTTEGEAALTRPPYETLRELWEAYAEYFDLDEFRRIDAIKGQTGKGRRGFTDPGQRRDEIAAALAECPVGQWVKIDDFSTHLRAAGHHFQVTSDPWPLYFNEPRYDSLGYGGYHGWNILQFRYLLCVLMEYIATLGLIDIGYIPPDGARGDYHRMPGADNLLWLSRYDGLMYLRLNAFGAYCLNLTATYEPRALEVPVALAISAGLRVTATADLMPADRLLLDTFAKSVRKDVWQLDRDCTLAALAAGRTITEITQLLESAGGGPLPDAAVELFADAEDRIGAFTDHGPARLVRCRDGALASLVSQNPLTHKTCHRVSENVLVVPGKSEAAFLKGLRELGFVLPARGRNG